MIEGSRAFHIGEMAHLIARSADGPRGEAGGGEDTYDNLILLCANCHTAIDKNPASYPEGQLRKWKSNRESEVELAGKDEKFSSADMLRAFVGRLLAENHQIFSSVGPKSNIADEDPGSDAVSIWEARKLDTILPNNKKIINVVEANAELLDSIDWRAFAAFKDHALAYEQQQFGRTDFYPTFPQSFAERFG